MLTPQKLKEYLTAGLSCTHLSVDGDGAHFEAVIVSSEFEGKNRVQRHQHVYKALNGRIESGEVHALSMKTLTPAEWDAR